MQREVRRGRLIESHPDLVPLAGLDLSPPDFLGAEFAASEPGLAPGVVAIVRDAKDSSLNRAADLDDDQDMIARGGEEEDVPDIVEFRQSVRS